MEDKVMRVLDSKGNLVLKDPMFKNRTIKIGLNVIEHRHLEINATREGLIWHYRHGHLNFRDLNSTKMKGMVLSLPKIPMQYEVCEECV